MQSISPFRLMNTAFLGLTLSLFYGALSAIAVYLFQGQADYLGFLSAYTLHFKTLLSLGLIFGAALVVYRSQSLIPDTIQAAFSKEQLRKTDYFFYKKRFASRRRSITFSAEFIVVAFFIFTQCRFPLQGIADDLMVIPACAEYALGVYVGRKLCYAGLMLHALLKIDVTLNIFKAHGHRLDEINTYVNVISTLTIIFVYVHVFNYYDAPFECNSFLGESARAFLIVPAIIATPVLLIFNFYPRVVLRKIYSQSVDVEVKALQKKLRDQKMDVLERESYLLEFERMSRDEVRYRLQLALSDLPIGITILIMIIQPLLGN